MRRRDFIKAIAGSAITGPLVARAQQPAMPVVGFLGTTTPDDFADRVAAFREGLKEIVLRVLLQPPYALRGRSRQVVVLS
jgi:putative ABC transport system substrate-binding protein